MNKRKIYHHLIALTTFASFTFYGSSYNMNLQLEPQLFLKTTSNPTLAEIKQMPIDEIIQLPVFDGRELNIVTPVRNQGSWKICWAYSFAAISETNMLYQHEKFNDPIFQKDTLNISPFNIDNIVNIREGSYDPLGLTSQDKFRRSLNGNTQVYNYKIPQTFYQGKAPITRKNEQDQKPFGPAIATLADIISVPNDKNTASNVTEIKKAIAQYGGVSISYKNSKQDVYYYPTRINPDHASAIIGWNDTIKKDQFTNMGKYQPASQDGAWIVKNSWGEGLLDKGYFYLSYDARFEDPTAINYHPLLPDSNIYYYDGKGEVTTPASSNHIIKKPVSAIFPVLKANATKDEFLKTITFSVHADAASKVKVSVYGDVLANFTDPKDETNHPEQGVLLFQKEEPILPYTSVGMYDISHTITLQEPIKLRMNGNYSIVLELIGSDQNHFWFSNETSDNDMTYSKINDQWVSHVRLQDNLGDHPVATIKATTILLDKTTGDKDFFSATIEFGQNNVVYLDNKQYQVSLRLMLNQQEVNKQFYDVILEPEINPNATDAGRLKVTVQAKAPYQGYQIAFLPIKKAAFPPITQDNITVDGQGQVTISATDTFFQPLIYFSDINLPPDWNFIHPNNSLQLTSQIIYSGVNRDCYLKTTLPITINLQQESIDISDASVAIEGTYVYNKTPLIPQFKVSYQHTTLVPNIDYTFNITNNINAGDGIITITGKKYFLQTKTVTFKILKANNELLDVYIENGKIVIKTKYEDSTFQPEVSYYYDEACTKKIEQLPTTPGTYYAKITIPETNNFNKFEQVKQFIVPTQNNNNNLIMIIAITGTIVILLLIIFFFIIKRVKNKKN